MVTLSIALVIHGNAFLSGRPPSPFPLEAIATKGSTFAFSVAEKNSNGEIMEQQVASTPEEWFAYLAQAQARGLQFYYAGGTDDLRRVWMANGVSYAIEVLLPENITELWVANVHTVGPPQPVSAQKGWLRGKVFPMLLSWNDTSVSRSWAWKIFLEPPILMLMWPYNFYLLVSSLVDFVIPRRQLPSEWHWHWTYQRTWSGIALSSAPTELDASAAELAESLELAQAFALRHDLADFAGHFNKALAILRGQAEPDSGNLEPDGFLSPQARRLLAACREGWQFGGQGWWNNLDYSTQPEAETLAEHEKITGPFYVRMMAAITAATNSSLPRR